MISKKLSDGVLVFDRYYRSKPVTAVLLLKKAVLCCVLSVCAMMYILKEYGMAVNLPFMAGATAVFSLVFTLIFVLVKKRIAIPVILASAGIVIWVRFEHFWERFSYFVDEAMLLFEGRFLYPRDYLLHDEVLRTAYNPFYTQGIRLGCLLMCAAFAMVCAASMSRRTKALPPVITFIVLCVPRLISEELEFDPWIIPVLAVFAYLAAVSLCYSGGLAVKHSSSRAYRDIVSREEKSFLFNTAKAAYPKRLEMRQSFYSKYYSVGLYCGSMITAAVMISACVFGQGSSIDYTDVYDFIMNIGNDSGITASPFEDGPVSEYFSNSDTSSRSGSLNIISPGKGEEEIIRVSFTGESPIYLRGDIGIDFSGASWSSPVGNEPVFWYESGLKSVYCPCEALISRLLLTATGNDADALIASSDVTIDYLCDSSVVFLPAYTAEFSYLNNEIFDVFGDVVVRVNREYGGVNSVQCTALIPAYTETDNSDSLFCTDSLNRLEQVFEQQGCSVNDLYGEFVGDLAAEGNVITDYSDFVRETYLDVPVLYRSGLDVYLRQHGIRAMIDNAVPKDASTAMKRYITADLLSDYLRENYTYSLSVKNNTINPVMSFLNDTKSGHCSLYASSLTLLLRQLGIPARYCTGFVVDPSECDGSVVLKSKNLHAWCEVYLGELGWTIFDPTSSSVYSENDTAPNEGHESRPEKNSSSSPVPSRPESVPRPPLPETEPTTSPVSPVVEEQVDYSRYIPLAIAVVLVIAVITVVLILAMKYNELKKRAALRLAELKQNASADSAAAVYNLSVEILAFCKLTPQGGEMPDSYFRRVDERFGTSFSENISLLEAVAFGSYSCTGEECLRLAELLDMLVASAETELGFMEKIKLRKLIIK